MQQGARNQLTTYQDFVAGKPVRLTLAAGWWSERRPAVEGLSIVTGMTGSRLDQLEAQCAAWRGRLVAAVYLGLQQAPGDATLTASNKQLVAEAAAQLDALHRRLESAAAPGGCALDAMLLVETVSQRVMRWMLPINTLRNHALLAARTPLVAMVDVDLLPSAGLVQWLQAPGNMGWLQQQCSQRKVFVLPAFETAPQASQEAAHALAAAAVAQDKAGLLAMVDRGQLWQFALRIFKQGHNMTDLPRWFATAEPYRAGWTRDYEPWFIADRTLVPWYDSVFRGYGWNKVSQVNNVHHQGFEFVVHPAGFLVHREHGSSKAGALYQASKVAYEKAAKQGATQGELDTSLAGTTHKFRNRVLEQLARGTYAPVLDDGLTGCLAKLPWWRERRQLQRPPPPQAPDVAAAGPAVPPAQLRAVARLVLKRARPPAGPGSQVR